jgi:hypothetical protein
MSMAASRYAEGALFSVYRIGWVYLADLSQNLLPVPDSGLAVR